MGEDGFHLLTAAWRPDAPVWLRRVPALQTLRQAWLQQYHRDQAGVRAREGDDLPPGQDRLASPYDAEARYGTKRTTSWVGYCLHITETCDDDAPRLITDVATTSAAEGDDSQALPAVHTRLGVRELLPSEQLVDSGYDTASTLVAARREHGIDLVGPARPIVRRDGHERFGHDDFQIDDERRLAVCPAEQTSVSWATTRSSSRTRIPLVQIRFDAATCRDCPLRSRCTTAGNGKWGRALTLREPPQRAALQQRRREQDTDAWRARYRLRAGSSRRSARSSTAPTPAAAATGTQPPPTLATASPPPPSTSSASTPGTKDTAPKPPAPPTYTAFPLTPRNERSATGPFREESVKVSYPQPQRAPLGPGSSRHEADDSAAGDHLFDVYVHASDPAAALRVHMADDP
ncbi:transposase, partial [Streptomyces sp. IB201691-2A2]|uniref:transposase n=1 Tax=Streptomyces sp. IB201691-2A2 TaxID=2561920 RepID=UPI0011928164